MANEPEPLAGRVAVVTAAAGAGIGGAVVRRLGQDGATVIASDVHERRLSALGAETGAEVEVVDAGDADALTSHLDEILARHGRIDVLVNCAGINIVKPTWELTDDEWHRIFDVNVTSIVRAARVALPAMQKQASGSIVNIASVGAWHPSPGEAAYSASKAAVVALTRAMALEVAADGIRVNAVAPGFVDHAAVERVYPADRIEALRAAAPQGRGVHPGEVASVVAWLAGDGSTQVTGETITVAGGAFFR